MMPVSPLSSLLGGNAFASGGLLLMAVGSVLALMRKVPEHFMDFLVRQCTVLMTINDDSAGLEWFKIWYSNQPHSKKNRKVDLHSKPEGNIEDSTLVLGPGNHFMWYKKRPLYISFTRQTDGKKGGYNAKSAENISIRMFGRSQNICRQLVEEMKAVYLEVTAKDEKIFTWSQDYWYSLKTELRPLDSVIISDECKNILIEDINHFKESDDWYREMGIPYHRGYLFYGPAGTGKTSLIAGLASYFKTSLYTFQLSTMTDTQLLTAVRRLPRNCFVVLEDIDCAVNNREKPKKNKKTPPTNNHRRAVDDDGYEYEEEEDEEGFREMPSISLSTLLNVLDGLVIPTGVLFFMTTNYIERLDSALIRAGRVDVRLNIAKATDEQKCEIYRRFFPEDTQEQIERFIENAQPVDTMADIQALLLAERNKRLTSRKAALALETETLIIIG
jgi:mitochondrial chaperone BCS1